MTFLYINSYIFFRPKINNEEVLYNPEEKPEAFFRSLKTMAEDLKTSKDSITQCIKYLTSQFGDINPLLIKKEVGSVQQDPNKPPKNLPNIYVLNQEGYEKEIEWALKKMLKAYNIDSFGELKGRKKCKNK